MSDSKRASEQASKAIEAPACHQTTTHRGPVGDGAPREGLLGQRFVVARARQALGVGAAAQEEGRQQQREQQRQNEEAPRRHHHRRRRRRSMRHPDPTAARPPPHATVHSVEFGSGGIGVNGAGGSCACAAAGAVFKVKSWRGVTLTTSKLKAHGDLSAKDDRRCMSAKGTGSQANWRRAVAFNRFRWLLNRMLQAHIYTEPEELAVSRSGGSRGR